MIYVILGMHKSGTTLLSQILHHSGINMGEFDVQTQYDQGNKYERDSTKAINQQILGSEGIFSLDIKTPDTLEATEEQYALMHKIIQDCSEKYAHWGFKDPRTCLVYPLWASMLPEHRIIAIYRSPAEMWRRYRARNPLLTVRAAWKLIKSWYEHNKRIDQYLESTELNFLVLNYRELMTTQTEFERLQQFVGTNLCDQRDISLYRGQPREYFLLKIMEWLFCTLKYRCPSDIISKFDSYRIEV